MANAKRNYKFEKRQKDLAKQKKKEEKRQRKLQKKQQAAEGIESDQGQEAGSETADQDPQDSD